MTEEVNLRGKRKAKRSPNSLLVDASTAASDIFDCSLRQFYKLRQHEEFPAPVMLGPRIVRYRRSSLEAFVDTLVAPSANQEPEQLAAGKARKARRQRQAEVAA